MECTKYQEIDLTEHFSTEYLDTAPSIQVNKEMLYTSFWYHYKQALVKWKHIPHHGLLAGLLKYEFTNGINKQILVDKRKSPRKLR